MNYTLISSLYSFLKTKGYEVKSFNSEDNTILLNCTSAETAALVAGLNFFGNIHVEAVLVSTCVFRLRVINLI